MDAPINHLKTALGGSRCTMGIWLVLASPAVAEMASHSGLDWLMIDAEHGPNTLTTIGAQLQGASAGTASAVVRVRENDAALAKQMLDLGAQSLIFPMIHDAAGAAAAVAACRYPPHGIRGIGSSIARASLWGTRENYMDTAQDQICVIVQAESRAAVENIDAIAATDGVDCVFIGPADLAADMGHTNDPTHPEVEEAILHLTNRTIAAGKAPGFFCTTTDMGRKFVAAGGRMMAIGTDSRLLNSGIQSVLGK